MFRDLRGLLALALLITALVVVGFLALGVGAMTVSALIATQAKAECDIFHCEPRRRVQRRRSNYRAPRRKLNYYAPPLDDDPDTRWLRDDNPRPICVERPLEVTSTEHTTPDNALEAAQKLWAAAAQWREGSQYMSLELARDFRFHCGQANAMDTATGKLNEAVSQLAGKSGVNVRCIIRARPCRAILERAEGMR
jgi:hypothetical protein